MNHIQRASALTADGGASRLSISGAPPSVAKTKAHLLQSASYSQNITQITPLII